MSKNNRGQWSSSYGNGGEASSGRIPRRCLDQNQDSDHGRHRDSDSDRCGWGYDSRNQNRNQNRNQSRNQNRNCNRPGRNYDHYSRDHQHGRSHQSYSSQPHPDEAPSSQQNNSMRPLLTTSNDTTRLPIDSVTLAPVPVPSTPASARNDRGFNMTRDEANYVTAALPASSITDRWTHTGLSFDERVDEFNELSWTDKLQLNGFPPATRYGTPLPDTFPDEVLYEKAKSWTEKKDAAVKQAIEAVKAKFFAVPHDNGDDSSSVDEGGGYSTGSSDDYVITSQTINGVRQSVNPGLSANSNRTKRKRHQQQQQYYFSTYGSNFLTALKHCLLFEAGFRVTGIHADDERNCWCPCGKYMSPWRNAFALQGGEIQSSSIKCDGSNGSKVITPMGLMSHLRKLGESCPLHFGVERYVSCLYGDYYHLNLGHKALYNNNDGRYRAAVAAEKEQDVRDMEKVNQQRIEAERKVLILETEKEQSEKKLEELGKVNEELKKKVKKYVEGKEFFGFSNDEKATEVSKKDLKAYRLSYDMLLENKKMKSKATSMPITVHVENNFKLQELFDRWYDESRKKERRDKLFLFRELSHGQKQGELHFHAHKLLGKLVVEYKEEYATNTKKRESAIDEGGPTREFLASVWKQMQILAVTHKDKKVSLFDNESHLAPEINYKICPQFPKDDELSTKAKLYYRAIGRIMLLSLSTGHPIPDVVLPRFFKNVLFRDCDLQDESYPGHEVYDDLVKGMGIALDESRKLIGTDFLESNLTKELITKETFFTHFIHETVIDSRSIAISALREGLTLNDFVPLSTVFSVMPSNAMIKIAFADTEINVEDVINILIPEYTETTDLIMKKNQEYFFEEIIKPLFREKSKKNPSFICQFVQFVTGLNYVPHPDAGHDFKITIMFDIQLVSNSLPCTHTCIKSLEIPADAYHNNRKVFEEKLDLSIAMAANAFSTN